MEKNFSKIFRWRALLAMCALGLLTGIASAEDMGTASTLPALGETSDNPLDYLAGSSFNLVVSYAQTTFKQTRDIGKTQITDNGAAYPSLEIISDEREFTNWPMQTGSIILGWDAKAIVSGFDTRFQLINSAVHGDDIGTRVSGNYVAIAPAMFFKVGPLYDGGNIFWKFGYGVGAGLLSATGTAQFPGSNVYQVNSSYSKIGLYQDAFWQFLIGNWQLEISGRSLSLGDQDRTSLETYGISGGYRISF